MAAKYTISVNVYEENVEELMPLYEESNRLMAEAGYAQWTFEHWYEMMLTFGSIPRIKRNAELLIKQTKNHLERGEKNVDDDKHKVGCAQNRVTE